MPDPGPIRPVRFFGEHPNKRQKWPKSEWSLRGFVVRGTVMHHSRPMRCGYQGWSSGSPSIVGGGSPSDTYVIPGFPLVANSLIM